MTYSGVLLIQSEYTESFKLPLIIIPSTSASNTVPTGLTFTVQKIQASAAMVSVRVGVNALSCPVDSSSIQLMGPLCRVSITNNLPTSIDFGSNDTARFEVTVTHPITTIFRLSGVVFSTQNSRLLSNDIIGHIAYYTTSDVLTDGATIATTTTIYTVVLTLLTSLPTNSYLLPMWIDYDDNYFTQQNTVLITHAVRTSVLRSPTPTPGTVGIYTCSLPLMFGPHCMSSTTIYLPSQSQSGVSSDQITFPFNTGIEFSIISPNSQFLLHLRATGGTVGSDLMWLHCDGVDYKPDEFQFHVLTARHVTGSFTYLSSPTSLSPIIGKTCKFFMMSSLFDDDDDDGTSLPESIWDLGMPKTATPTTISTITSTNTPLKRSYPWTPIGMRKSKLAILPTVIQSWWGDKFMEQLQFIDLNDRFQLTPLHGGGNSIRLFGPLIPNNIPIGKYKIEYQTAGSVNFNSLGHYFVISMECTPPFIGYRCEFSADQSYNPATRFISWGVPLPLRIPSYGSFSNSPYFVGTKTPPFGLLMTYPDSKSVLPVQMKASDLQLLQFSLPLVDYLTDTNDQIEILSIIDIGSYGIIYNPIIYPSRCTQVNFTAFLVFACNCANPNFVGLGCKDQIGGIPTDVTHTLVVGSSLPIYHEIRFTPDQTKTTFKLANLVRYVLSATEPEFSQFKFTVDSTDDQGTFVLAADVLANALATNPFGGPQFPLGVFHPIKLDITILDGRPSATDQSSALELGTSSYTVPRFTLSVIQPRGSICGVGDDTCIASSYRCKTDPTVTGSYVVGIGCNEAIYHEVSDKLNTGIIRSGSTFGLIITSNDADHVVNKYTNFQLYSAPTTDQPNAVTVDIQAVFNKAVDGEVLPSYSLDVSSISSLLVYNTIYNVYATDEWGVHHDLNLAVTYSYPPLTTMTITTTTVRLFDIQLNCPPCLKQTPMLWYELHLIRSSTGEDIDILSVDVTPEENGDRFKGLYQFPHSVFKITVDMTARYLRGGDFLLELRPVDVNFSKNSDYIAQASKSIPSTGTSIRPDRRCGDGIPDPVTAVCTCPVGYFGPLCIKKPEEVCPLDCPPTQVPDPECQSCICLTNFCKHHTYSGVLRLSFDPVLLKDVIKSDIFQLRTMLTSRIEFELTQMFGLNRLTKRSAMTGEDNLDSFFDVNNLYPLLNDPSIQHAPPIGLETIHIHSTPPIETLVSNWDTNGSLPADITLRITLSVQPHTGLDTPSNSNAASLALRWEWFQKVWDVIMKPNYDSYLTGTIFGQYAMILSSTNRLMLGNIFKISTTTRLQQAPLLTAQLRATCAIEFPDNGGVDDGTRFTCPSPAQRSPLWHCGNNITQLDRRGVLSVDCGIVLGNTGDFDEQDRTNPVSDYYSNLTFGGLPRTESGSFIGDKEAPQFVKNLGSICPLWPQGSPMTICGYYPELSPTNKLSLTNLRLFTDQIYFGEPFGLGWDIEGNSISATQAKYFEIAIYFTNLSTNIDFFLTTVNLSENPVFITPPPNVAPLNFVQTLVHVKIVLLKNVNIFAKTTIPVNLNPSRLCNGVTCLNGLVCDQIALKCVCQPPMILDRSNSLSDNDTYAQCVLPCRNNGQINTSTGKCDCAKTQYGGDFCEIPLKCNVPNSAFGFLPERILPNQAKIPLVSNVFPYLSPFCSNQGYETSDVTCNLKGACQCSGFFDPNDNCKTCLLTSQSTGLSNCDSIGTNTTETNKTCQICICKHGFGGNLCQYRALLGSIATYRSGATGIADISQGTRNRLALDIALSIGVNARFVLLDNIQQEFFRKNNTLVTLFTFSILSSDLTRNVMKNYAQKSIFFDENEKRINTNINNPNHNAHFNYYNQYLKELSSLHSSSSSSSSSSPHFSSLQSGYSANPSNINAWSSSTVPPSMLDLYQLWSQLQQNRDNSSIGNTQAGNEVGQVITPIDPFDPYCTVSTSSQVMASLTDNSSSSGDENNLGSGADGGDDDGKKHPQPLCPNGVDPYQSIEDIFGQNGSTNTNTTIVVTVVLVGGVFIGLVISLVCLKKHNLCCFVPHQNARRPHGSQKPEISQSESASMDETLELAPAKKRPVPDGHSHTSVGESSHSSDPYSDTGCKADIESGVFSATGVTKASAVGVVSAGAPQIVSTHSDQPQFSSEDGDKTPNRHVPQDEKPDW
jgi:hypothetical protein